MTTPNNSIAKAKEALDQLAPLIGRYVASLVESGLTRAEAISMAQALQQTAFQTALILAQNAPPEGRA